MQSALQFGSIWISIHALHEESDQDTIIAFVKDVFQSTLSMRRATFQRIVETRLPFLISIHALHEESDLSAHHRPKSWIRFQSTLSMRRATPPCLAIATSVRFQSTLSMRRATEDK